MSEFEFAKDGLSAEESAKLTASIVRASDLVVRVPDVSDIEGASLYAKIPDIPKDRPAPPLDEYVAEAVLAARRVGESMMRRKLTEASSKQDRADASKDVELRVAAADRYARWRWQGYKDAEIASL